MYIRNYVQMQWYDIFLILLRDGEGNAKQNAQKKFPNSSDI